MLACKLIFAWIIAVQSACKQMQADESHNTRMHEWMNLLLLEGIGPLQLQPMLEVAETHVFLVPLTCQSTGELR